MVAVGEPGGMRVLVLGGTAFLGRRVVKRLQERGDQILVVHRGRSTTGWRSRIFTPTAAI